ncbi:MAG: tandem-95 repeat protein [Rubripirellula sp.]
MLNNLVSGFATGLDIDASSENSGTIVGGNAFQNNATDSTIALASSSISINGPVFQDPTRRIYIPIDGSTVIDSSFSELADRFEYFNTVKDPVGISASPIKAPVFDAYGQPRFDDPLINPPGAGGEIVTIDRGAIDRADRSAMIAVLTGPQDSIGAIIEGGDGDPDESFVRLSEGRVEFFEVQLLDEAGTGPDKDTITPESVLLTENGRRLIPDVDFVFSYNDNSRTIRLTPLAGLWLPDAVYEITLNNQQRIQYEVPSGSEITDGDQVIVQDTSGNELVFEYESGFSLSVPQTTLLTITGPNADFQDRDTFTISSPGGNTLAFEINLAGATAGGNVPVQLASASTIGEVRDVILATLDGTLPNDPLTTIKQFLDIDPVAIGTDQIQLGTLAGHTIPVSISGLGVTGQAGGVADSESFTFTSPDGSVVVEFDSDGSASGDVVVPITRTDTPGEIAASIALALQTNVPALSGVISVDDGTVVLGGNVGETVAVDQSSLVLNGAPGVTGSLSLTVPPAETGSSIDDSAFTVDVDGVAITFRYTTDPMFTSPDRLILLSPTDLVNGIARNSADVIALAFPDELSPTSVGDTIILGEQAAIPPTGQPGSFTTVDGGTAGLLPGGVSGGAIPVSYLPSSPRTSIAATLQGRIADSPLQVETFSPGGGTILISDAQSLSAVTSGTLQAGVGVLTPAVADLAGNAVRETRINNETRFTIIMPDVLFDLGDAPISYSTLFRDNGARHTVGGPELPRLGQFVDTEEDALVVNLDDAPFDVSLNQTPIAPALFTIDSITIPDADVISLNRMPAGGETLTIAVGPIFTTFELVEITSNPVGANVAVNFSDMDTIEEVNAKLLATIRATLTQTDDGLLIEQDSPTSIIIIAVDDEDGVSEGVFSDGTTNRTVFTVPGTNPSNIQAEDVLGFLNPQDPAGTNIAVTVAGSGLLHGWIDFDKNGVFDSSEQVLKNVPVSGDPVAGSVNFVTVFTPPTALEGDTWMRLRISESGNLLPTGVAVGGEVEDYPVQIISIPLPVPEDDVYQISEDNTLDTLTDGLPSLDGVGTATPDFIPPEAFLPPQFIAGVLPQNGTLVSLDPNTGHFVYLPNNDFNGVDTFTYRLSTQQNASASVIDQDEFATVTISVAPVNDPPGATDQAYTAVEDGPLVISAAELLATASADSDAQGTTPDPLDPNLPFLNEENQQLYVASVQGIGAVITAANAASAAGNLVVTTNGSGIDLQVSNITDSDVVSLAFAGTTVTFELVPENGIPSGGTVAIPMVSTDSTASVAARLQNAIQAAFTSSTPAILVGQSGDTVSVSFTPLTVSAVGSAAFTVTPGAGSLIVDVSAVPTPTAAATPADPNPVVGDTLTLTYGTSSVTFELIAEGATAAAGNTPITVRPFAVPVAPPVGASAADVARFTAAMNAYNAALRASAADQLNSAIQTELLANNVGVTSTIVDGATSPNRIDVQAAAITAGKSFDTPRGSAIAVFDGFGDLIELRYISNQDLNRDNPPPATPTHLDSFVYTVRDSGVSIDLTNSVVDYGMPGFSTPPTSVVLDVAPQNDAPILNPDLISVGPLGPDAGTVLTAWEIFGGATPTEDTTLQIDPAFLLSNDMRARMTAADENVAGSLNDLGLSIQSVTMANPAQGSVTRLFDGTIVFTPAPDIFGDIIFTYSARDQGINESVNGVRTAVPLISFDGTVTVSVQPVNDIPVAFDRALDFTESADPGPGDPFVFTSDELIFGDVGETANIPGSFPPALQAPFNESEQTLRVVAFTTAAGTVDASSLTGTGAEMLTLPSDAGGTFEFDFVDGVFTVGRFVSSADYNARTPFAASESFSYVIADDGLTTDPQNSGNTFTLPDSLSDDDVAAVSAVVTITVGETNDAPTFGLNAPVIGGLPTIDVLERDDMVGTTINGFAVNIMPGPSSASDEIDRQSVVFSFPANLNPSSNVPDGLFTQLPELSPTGQLTVFPAPDAIGTATIVVLAEDLEPGTVGFTPRQTLATFVVNVQPVNDRPRFDPALFGTGDSDNPDEAYDIAQGVDFNNDGLIDQATISYTLREDNTQPLGVLEEYFIPLRAAASVGYSRLGLLDVFTVGPDNEAGAFPGGVQTLEFLRGGNDPVSPSLDRTTDRGGILTPVFDTNDVLIGLNYQPPLDFNIAFAGVDSFTYEVRDDSTTGGETYSLAASALIPDRRVSSNRVELRLNPVNDRPQFDTTTLNIDVQEDSAVARLVNYASPISAGPPATAFDEVDVLTGQLVEFTVTSLDFPREESDDFFTIYPSVDNNTGLLNFRPAADVFGEYRFELVLNDSNRDGSISDNTTRGDLISSIPVTLTINVQPVNDPPLVDPGAAPLNFTILEDGSFEILIDGDNTSPGLLDPFFPGPAVGATDESADISPLVGGNQTVSLGQPVPSNSAQGGTVQLITTGGSPRLRYTPRTNFVGMDSFIYTVTDDGITVLPDGSQISDPKIASNIVTFDVQPVNDAPRFSGAANVQSNEDGGVIAIENWAANILAGPVTATDEVSGVGTAQSLGFVFTQVSSNPELFTTPPTAVIDPITGTAVLTYEAAPDANGIATFEVLLEDNGPRDASIGDEFRSDPPRTFLINVQPVNDPPSFDLVNSQISRVEDSGPFNVIQAINVSPGPADEAGQTVTFELEPLAPQFASLFSEQPSINADGLLRFTPAPNQNTDNANGPAIIRVFARDSESPAAVSDSVEFQIAISEVNDAPRAFSDAIRSDEDTVLTISSAQLLANDIDPDLQSNVAETVSIVMPQVSTSVSGAQVVFDPATGEITYDPSTSTALQSLAPNEQLVDSFAYSLIDASGATSNLVTVGLTIDGINDAPVLNLDAPQLNPDGSTTIAVLANDSDVDGFIDPSSLQITLQPAFGSVVVLPNGSLEYTPFASFPQDGVDEFTYTVADNLGLRSEEAIVSISSNASPIAVGDARGTFVDESIIIDVAANDSDPDGTLNLSSIVIVSQPNRGQAVPQSDGTVQYLPDPGFLGRDTFQYRIADDLGRFSNIADVETQVVASRLQNPDRFSDVNDDGAVSAVDALLIINRLSRSDSISIPVTEADRGPNFFDTNGNQNITASDALRVINELSRLNAGPGISGEQVDVLPLAAGEAEDVSSTVASIAPVDLLGPVKIVDTKAASPVAADVIDLIAAERESNSDDESSLDAIDAAMADLL